MPAWIYVLAVAAVLTVAWYGFARRWWHALRYSWRSAKHLAELTETEVIPGAEYGSMILEDDPNGPAITKLLRRYGEPGVGPHDEGWAPLPPLPRRVDWRERTRRELAPEALDEDPWCRAGDFMVNTGDMLAAPPAGPGPGGEGSSSSPPPGPDHLDGGPTVSGPEGAEGVNAPPVQPSRLADTGEIRDAHLLAEVAAELRAQDDDARAYCSALERDRQTYMHQLREVFA